MKILVCGDVNGEFKTLFTRVESILKKTPGFDGLFCCGSFFSDTFECIEQWELIKTGKLTVPLPIFILGPSKSNCVRFYEEISPDGGELVNNITCLGQRGVYTMVSGLQVAYLSGSYEKEEYLKKQSPDSDSISPFFRQDDIASLCKTCTSNDTFKGVDLLLTNEWPQGVTNNTSPPEGLTDLRVGSMSVSKIAVQLCPRYHFVGSMSLFYERVPYSNTNDSGNKVHSTRFISLANVGNPNKKNRYLYAFTVTPLSQMDPNELLQSSDQATESPYKEMFQKVRGVSAATSVGGSGLATNYFYDVKEIEETRKQQQREQDRLMRQFDPSLPPAKRRQPPQPQGPCWFCLSSPQVEKHLIVSIGDNSYLALSKGGLVNEHILILPIGHYPSSMDAPQEVMEEVYKFKQCLRKYFASKGQSCVMYERNFRSQHLQIQVVPVPKAIDNDTLRESFKECGTDHKVEFAEIERESDLNKLVPSGTPYFLAEFSTGPSLLARIKGYFPIHFGREVLASPSILNVPRRINWKECSLSKEKEAKVTQTFRDNFQPFDFTVEDDD